MAPLRGCHGVAMIASASDFLSLAWLPGHRGQYGPQWLPTVGLLKPDKGFAGLMVLTEPPKTGRQG